MIKTLKRWASERQTVRELSILSRRELADIGVSREEIRDLAKAASY